MQQTSHSQQSESGTFTIIIATYNRSDTLAVSLSGYLKQSSPELIKELLIIDDGSRAPFRCQNKTIVDKLSKIAPFPIRYIVSEHRGPASARNLGILNSSSDYVLITGDDIEPHQDMVREHYASHQKNGMSRNICVLGKIEWPHDKKVTPFMKYINEMGLQFGYSIISDENDASFIFFYASNVSLRQDFLLEGDLFDIEFPYAAWEDTELAYRLKNRGMRIIYNMNAFGYHHHDISFYSFKKRQMQSGYAACLFCRKHVELKHLLRINRPIETTLVDRVKIGIYERFCEHMDTYIPIPFPRLYRTVMDYYYKMGISKYNSEHQVELDGLQSIVPESLQK